jgi:sec-independent protein translocase protein TatA
MGLGGISIWQLVIILVIVLLIFGTKRLKGLGGDLGGAIKGFKEAIATDDNDETETENKSEAGETSQAKEQATEAQSSDKTV